MAEPDPQYAWAAHAAAEIVNLHLNSGEPKAEAFRRILFVILGAMPLVSTSVYRSIFSSRRRASDFPSTS